MRSPLIIINLIIPVNRAKSLYFAVRDYLGVTREHLHDPRMFQAGEEFWLIRPLWDYQLLAAARDSIYLLELNHILQVGLEEPVRRATRDVMESTVNLTDQENEEIIPFPAVRL